MHRTPSLTPHRAGDLAARLPAALAALRRRGALRARTVGALPGPAESAGGRAIHPAAARLMERWHRAGDNPHDAATPAATGNGAFLRLWSAIKQAVCRHVSGPCRYIRARSGFARSPKETRLVTILLDC